MDKKQLEILTNIIGGVESGGQVYGQRRYEAYAGKRANSANEKTCTLGWAQNYFTFQYVSINTSATSSVISCFICLYIPICFY